MDYFLKIIDVLVYASVGIGLVKSYLMVNKVWIRRHDKAVAESISVFANIMGLLVGLPFLIKYNFLVHDYKSGLGSIVGLVVGLIFLLIGIGVWVKSDGKRPGLWSLFKKALKLEGSEAADMLKGLAAPTAARQILVILHQLAAIDQDYDDKERAFIKGFADAWHLSLDEIEQQNQDKVSYLSLRQNVTRYLAAKPPEEQVMHLKEVMTRLMTIDQKVSAEEKLIVDEVTGLLMRYIQDGKDQTIYQVVIAPQNQDQIDSLFNLLPDAQRFEKGGIFCVIVDTYYSQDFARMVCDQYRTLNFFTTVEVHEKAG